MIDAKTIKTAFEEANPGYTLLGMFDYDDKYYLLNAVEDVNKVDYNSPFYLVDKNTAKIRAYSPLEDIDKFQEARSKREIKMDELSHSEPWTSEDYLMHHGIKGQKWGVRRYQNPDGSLTEAGRKRYYDTTGKSGKVLTKAGAKAVGKDLAKLAKLRNMVKTFDGDKSSPDPQYYTKKYDEANKAFKKKWGEKQAGMIDRAREHEGTLDKMEKLNKKGDAIDKKVEFTSPLGKRYQENLEKAVPSKLTDAIKSDKTLADVDKDYWAPQFSKDRIKGTVDHQKAMDAANLGLKALDKIKANYSLPPDGKITGEDRMWFLYEDQTIGLPTAAHLINKGHSAKDVKKYYDTVSKNYDYDKDYDRYGDVIESLGDISGFVDACEEIKKSELKHSEPWTSEDFLMHHGIKGMKWGVRRFQNSDGSLTIEGRKRYSTGDFKKKVSELRAKHKEKAAARLERRKEKAIASGNADRIYKYASKMSNGELANAVSRAASMKQLSDLRKTKKSLLERASDTASRLNTYGTNFLNLAKTIKSIKDFRKKEEKPDPDHDEYMKKAKEKAFTAADEARSSTKGSTSEKEHAAVTAYRKMVAAAEESYQKAKSGNYYVDKETPKEPSRVQTASAWVASLSGKSVEDRRREVNATNAERANARLNEIRKAEGWTAESALSKRSADSGSTTYNGLNFGRKSKPQSGRLLDSVAEKDIKEARDAAAKQRKDIEDLEKLLSKLR